MNQDYVSVVYDEKRTPKTDYPSKLAAYLFGLMGMRRGDSLLEIGCGRGEFLLAFQDLGLKCQGVDLSDYCQKNQKDLSVACLDISKEPLPFKDNSFDYVYHKSLIEHLYSPDHLMEETFRVLKPGGKVVILTPDWVSQMKVFYEDFTHSRPYDVSSLGDVLKVYGFSGVSAQRFYQLPLIWAYPGLKLITRFLQLFISVPLGRKIASWTGMKFFRWSVELMVMATGTKGPDRG